MSRLNIQRFFARPLLVLSLRSAVIGVLWLIAPFWIFLLAVLYAYFVPFFRARTLFFELLLILGIGWTLPYLPIAALGMGTLIFLVLGIKDFLIVDREAAYEAFVFLAVFILVLETMARIPNWGSGLAGAAAAGAGAIGFLLLRRIPWRDDGRERDNLAAALTAFMFVQAGMGIMFLPVNYLYQAAALFLFFVTMVRLGGEIREGKLALPAFLFQFGTFVVAEVLILAIAPWKI